MKLIRNAVDGKRGIRRRLYRIAVTAIVIGGLSGGLTGALSWSAPAGASVSGTAHKVPSGIYPGAPGVTVLCTDPTGFTCAGAGYNGTSAQIGGNGWTTSQYWKFGSAGPNGTRHNCTTYAAYRLQRNGYAYPGWTDNANKWAADAQSHNVTVDQTPKVGSIAQWNSGYGHVAYVEAVTSAYIVTTSDSYGNDGKGRPLGTDRLQIARNSAYMPDNFIHFKDTPAAGGGTGQPAPPPAYHAGRQVTIDKHATGGVSGHQGPGNSYAAGPTRPANSALWIVCYVTGQSIKGPYDTTAMWDLSDDGYYYTDAWLYTGTNGAAVPRCAPRSVTVDKHATGGVSGHKGPGNSYAAGPTRAANTHVTIFCYVTGQSIKGPYDTTTVWDLSGDGYYYTDAWLYTGTNGTAVPRC